MGKKFITIQKTNKDTFGHSCVIVPDEPFYIKTVELPREQPKVEKEAVKVWKESHQEKLFKERNRMVHDLDPVFGLIIVLPPTPS